MKCQFVCLFFSEPLSIYFGNKQIHLLISHLFKGAECEETKKKIYKIVFWEPFQSLVGPFKFLVHITRQNTNRTPQETAIISPTTRRSFTFLTSSISSVLEGKRKELYERLVSKLLIYNVVEKMAMMAQMNLRKSITYSSQKTLIVYPLWLPRRYALPPHHLYRR